ncbi:MAG TPA: plastocyanin/azurin family copper-binding protein [Magnetospirillum sp.]|jgi:plastocyanin|nr:plastocyanin/azurin family copper-binding protein [Magnetospirillum sp.]
MIRCTRRGLLAGGLTMAAGLALPCRAAAAEAVIRTMSSPDGSEVWFDPVGLWMPPGTVVRWINGTEQANTHTATAYHPANGRHALRIPNGAQPWDSGYLLPGASFAATLAVEGVYDYFCQPHEIAGMVGRIVVGRPGSPPAPHPDWLPLPEAARRAFPSVDDILRAGQIRR